MAGLGIAGLGPICEVKVEVCGWEGKQQHPIYQRSRAPAAFPDPGRLVERCTSPGSAAEPQGHDPIPGSVLGAGRGRHTHPGEGKPFPPSYSLHWVLHEPAHPQCRSQKKTAGNAPACLPPPQSQRGSQGVQQGRGMEEGVMAG